MNIENAIKKIELLKPIPEKEAIVINFNPEDITPDRVVGLCDYLFKKFPYNPIVALPNTTTLETWNKDELENWISVVTEIIEDMSIEKSCKNCKNNVEYPPPHTCDECTSLANDEEYSMWEYDEKGI